MWICSLLQLLPGHLSVCVLFLYFVSWSKCFNQSKNRWINWKDLKGQGGITPCAENGHCWCLQFWDILKNTNKCDSKENICEPSTGVSELCFPSELISAGPVLLKERNTTIVPQITTELGEHSLEREMMPGAQHRNLATTLTLAFPILVLTLTPPVHLWQPLDHQTSLYTLHFCTFTLWHQGTMKYRLPFSLECKHTYTVACFDVFIIAFSETWFSFLFLVPLDHNNILSWKWRSLRDNNPGGKKIWIQGVLLLPQVLERIIWAGG